MQEPRRKRKDDNQRSLGTLDGTGAHSGSVARGAKERGSSKRGNGSNVVLNRSGPFVLAAARALSSVESVLAASQ